MPDEAQALMDKAAVVETTTRLFVGTDNRDWRHVHECFSPQFLFDMTSMAGGEPATLIPEEIVASWEKGLKALKAVHH